MPKLLECGGGMCVDATTGTKQGKLIFCASLLSGICALFAAPSYGQRAETGAPRDLKCESLNQPLGMDVPHPRLSWKLTDGRMGAKQTAYEIQVASSAANLAANKADVWDSGKKVSESSVNVGYEGPALGASRRYYWRVRAWDKDGKEYPASAASWWETGLLGQENWKAKWIGYEEPELAEVRRAGAVWITNWENSAPENYEDTHHNFRFHFGLKKGVRRGALYVAARDTVSAWMNGKQVLTAPPLPPWRQFPWKTYRVQDVTSALKAGANFLAIDAVHYAEEKRPGVADDSQTPMNATLYVEAEDGSAAVSTSSEHGCQAMLNASGNWQEQAFDDSAWKEAIAYKPPSETFD